MLDPHAYATVSPLGAKPSTETSSSITSSQPVWVILRRILRLCELLNHWIDFMNKLVQSWILHCLKPDLVAAEILTTKQASVRSSFNHDGIDSLNLSICMILPDAATVSAIQIPKTDYVSRPLIWVACFLCQLFVAKHALARDTSHHHC